MTSPANAAGAPHRRRQHPVELLRAGPPSITVDARLMEASGIGTYLQNLLPLILAAQPQWRFNLLGPEKLGRLPWAMAGNVALIRCDAPIYGLREQIQLAARIPRDTDLMWSPHYNIPLWYRGRLLVTIHDLCHLALPHNFPGPHRRAYARWMFSAVRRRATRILCDSEFTRRELERLAGRSKREPAVVHLGVSPSWFRIADRGSPHPRPYLLFVGNVKPHKNLATLIRAFQEIAPSIPHDLIIVGNREGLRTSDAVAYEAALSLGSRVHFPGVVSQPVLEQYFLHADLFVFPSLYEGFGLPPLEAMACGCPTIVAKAASLPEVCGNATLYFDPKDPGALAASIQRVLGSPELRLDLRKHGRRHAERFRWDLAAERTMKTMEDLLEP